MKTNKKAGVVALAALVAIGSYFIAGTYAKYTSSIAGRDTATVAKWSWTINSVDIESTSDVTNGYTFNLFDTINKDSNCTASETDVATGLIAPGVCGEANIVITNNSEVNAEYSIAFTETNSSNVPIEYSIDGGSTWTSTIADLDTTSSPASIAMNGGTNSSSPVTLRWRWAFTGASSSQYKNTQTDVTDTALGFAANTSAPTVQVTATVTVTQVD